jgi:hypothetical protein
MTSLSSTQVPVGLGAVALACFGLLQNMPVMIAYNPPDTEGKGAVDKIKEEVIYAVKKKGIKGVLSVVMVGCSYYAGETVLVGMTQGVSTRLFLAILMVPCILISVIVVQDYFEAQRILAGKKEAEAKLTQDEMMGKHLKKAN